MFNYYPNFLFELSIFLWLGFKTFWGIFWFQVIFFFCFIRYVFSRYLPPICGLSSHSLNSFKREVLNFNKVVKTDCNFGPGSRGGK